MGPAAWARVGQALGLALAASLFTGRNSVVAVLAREIQRAILQNDLEMARAMLRDMAWRHRSAFEEFLRKHADDLPPEARDEFKEYL